MDDSFPSLHFLKTLKYFEECFWTKVCFDFDDGIYKIRLIVSPIGFDLYKDDTDVIDISRDELILFNAAMS